MATALNRQTFLNYQFYLIAVLYKCVLILFLIFSDYVYLFPLQVKGSQAISYEKTVWFSWPVHRLHLEYYFQIKHIYIYSVPLPWHTSLARINTQFPMNWLLTWYKGVLIVFRDRDFPKYKSVYLLNFCLLLLRGFPYIEFWVGTRSAATVMFILLWKFKIMVPWDKASKQLVKIIPKICVPHLYQGKMFLKLINFNFNGILQTKPSDGWAETEYRSKWLQTASMSKT